MYATKDICMNGVSLSFWGFHESIAKERFFPETDCKACFWLRVAGTAL
jgi:hypothetical protein